jgi:hypothetical protein
MTELDVKLLDLAFRALEPKPPRVTIEQNPLDHCDVCGAFDRYDSFVHDWQNGREIALCHDCSR